MTRVSSFTILSGSVLDGKRVLMNGCFGGIDIITSELAEFLEDTIKSSPHGQAYVEEASFLPVTFADLMERGHLTSRSHEEEKSLAVEISLGMHEKEKKRPYVMIAPSMDCNYRCTYCFERHLQNGLNSDTGNISYKKNNVVMRSEMIAQIYRAIGKIRKGAGLDAGGMIILYGGEPLDSTNK